MRALIFTRPAYRHLLPAAWLLALAAGLAAQAQPQAPSLYQARCRTTSGAFTLTLHRDWAPRAADRFYQLLQAHYYQGNAFYRVVPGFVVQWGLNPTPALSQAWRKRTLPDDPVRHSNLAGTISFAAAGRNTRTTEVFINLADHPQLDKLGFAPFGEVTEGLATVRGLEGGYGDGPPRGHGPDPHLIMTQGAAYLTRNFPRLDVLYGCDVAPLAP
jgi:peptidyl-prolyl cis-trans isomerase A (cyclophilin A)